MTGNCNQSTKSWKAAAEFFEKNIQIELEDLQQNNDFLTLDLTTKDKIVKLFTNKQHNHTILDQPAGETINSVLDHDLSGQPIDAYQLIELIAHGGMSSVYRARRNDIYSQKDVAIKLIPTNLQTDETTTLFKRELETLAKLHHPNIISMHHGNVSQSGTPYLVMELIENSLQIDQYFLQHKTKTPFIINYFITLCHVIDYAHQNKVIHQDIKPSNVLMDEHGHLLVLDFGVAALTEVIPEHHAYTLSYAAPEQSTHKLSPQPAFDTFAITSLLIKCLSQCPDHLPGWQKTATGQLSIDQDLRVILDKGIEENSTNRYQQAMHLANDLSLWQNKLPISQLKHKPLYRLKKSISRHPTTTVLSFFVLLSMVLGLMFYQKQYQIALSESIKAQQVKGILIEAIDQNDPDISKGTDLTVRDMLKQVELSHTENIATDNDASKELFLTLAQAFNKLGDYASTENNIQKVLAIEPQNTQALLELAELKLQQKDIAQAQNAVDKIILKTTPSNVNTIRKHLVQADIAVINNKYDVADKLFIKAQHLAEQSDQPKIKIKVMAAYANGLLEQHKVNSAIEKINQAVQLSISALGELHSQTLSLKVKLAEAYLSSTGEGVSQATILFDQLIPQQKQLLGEYHPNVAKSLFLNSTALRSLNQLEQARNNAQQALLIAEKKLGKKHIFTGRVLMNLGAIYLAEKDHKNAINYAKMAVDNHQGKLGAEHPETLQYKTSYVAMLVEDQQHSEALKILLQIHPIQTAKLGANHRGTLFVDLVLSKTYTAMGQLEAGVMAGERCHNNAKNSETKNIMEVYCAMVLENAYFLNKQYAQSMSLIDQYQTNPLITSRLTSVKQFKDHKQFIQNL